MSPTSYIYICLYEGIITLDNVSHNCIFLVQSLNSQRFTLYILCIKPPHPSVLYPMYNIHSVCTSRTIKQGSMGTKIKERFYRCYTYHDHHSIGSSKKIKSRTKITSTYIFAMVQI